MQDHITITESGTVIFVGSRKDCRQFARQRATSAKGQRKYFYGPYSKFGHTALAYPVWQSVYFQQGRVIQHIQRDFVSRKYIQRIPARLK